MADECFYGESEVKPSETGQMIAIESGRPVEWVSEDNYRFRLHEYLPAVQKYLSQKQPIYPASRLNDLQPFLHKIQQEGLDLSVSRVISAAGGWGIPVPGDNQQIIYVWIDALASYLTAAQEMSITGPITHILGKDILK